MMAAQMVVREARASSQHCQPTTYPLLQPLDSFMQSSSFGQSRVSLLIIATILATYWAILVYEDAGRSRRTVVPISRFEREAGRLAWRNAPFKTDPRSPP